MLVLRFYWVIALRFSTNHCTHFLRAVLLTFTMTLSTRWQHWFLLFIYYIEHNQSWLSSACAYIIGNGYPTNKSQVYISQIGLLLLFPDYRIVRFSILLSMLSHQKMVILHCFAIRSSMFKGDCLSVNNDDGHAFSSRYVMLPTLPSPYLTLRLQCQIWIIWEVTTIMWICSKCLNQMFKFKKKHCLSSTRLVITCYTLNSRPCSTCGISSRPEG